MAYIWLDCLYRCIAYFLLNDQNYFQFIKGLIIDWVKNNYVTYCEFFRDDENNNIDKETLASKELEYMQKKNSWGGDIQINIICIILKLTVCVFYEYNGVYKRYFLFNFPNIENEELLLLLYVNNNHYDLIYPKKDNEKNKKIYNNPNLLEKVIKFGNDEQHYNILKFKLEYVKVKYPASENIYDEIYKYLFSLDIHKDDINAKIEQYKNMHIYQIYSFFPLEYPERLKGESAVISKNRKKFRELITNFKINEQNRLVIKNPYKEDLNNNEELWYKIPFNKEKEIIVTNYHTNNNHCGRDAIICFIKKEGWYWYGFFKDIENIIKACPQCNNVKGKFKKFKPVIKIITDNGPHYRYICDIWYLSNEISEATGFKYILDFIDHLSKWYQGYCLKTKSSKEVLSCIDSFIQSFGKPVILQADNGTEYSNNDLNNFCINNDIKLVHGRPRHPQSQGACESCHKEIKKFIYNKFIESRSDFNLLETMREITNIHNNKKHTITNEIPKDIKDLNDSDYINVIKERIKNNISRKNNNKDILNFNEYYVISSNLSINNNRIIKKKIKKLKML